MIVDHRQPHDPKIFVGNIFRFPIRNERLFGYPSARYSSDPFETTQGAFGRTLERFAAGCATELDKFQERTLCQNLSVTDKGRIDPCHAQIFSPTNRSGSPSPRGGVGPRDCGVRPWGAWRGGKGSSARYPLALPGRESPQNRAARSSRESLKRALKRAIIPPGHLCMQ